MLDNQAKEALIFAAIQAPAADNSQPFQFDWQTDDTLKLYIDKTRSGKASDNRFVLSDIALGAVIENIVVAAESMQLSAEVKLLPTQENSYHVADISFENNATQVDETNLADYIKERHTDRRFPFKGNIPQDAIARLSNITESHANGVKWFTDKKSIKAVLPVIQAAESIRFKSKTLHQELFSTVNFDDPNAEEGMPIEVLAIEKPAQPMFKLIRNWSVMNFLNKLRVYKVMGIRSVRIPILMSPALALICIKSNDRESVLNGGRALQRFWLQAAKEGIAVQPYAAPGIFSLGFVEHEQELDPAFETVIQMMKDVVPEGYGLMFLRLGYATKPILHRTNRRKPSSFQLPK